MIAYFKNQTGNFTPTDADFHKAPRDKDINIRVGGSVGAAKVFLILKHDTYGTSKIDLEVTDTNQGFSVNVDVDEKFAFQVESADGSTNFNLAFSY